MLFYCVDNSYSILYASLLSIFVHVIILLVSDCKENVPSTKVRDPETAKKLWEVSAKLVGLGDWDPFTAPDVTSLPS